MPTQVLSDLVQSKQLVHVVFQNWKLEVEKGNSIQLLALFAHYETKLLPAYFPSLRKAIGSKSDMSAALIAPIFRASGAARNSRSFSFGRHRVQGLPQVVVPDLIDEKQPFSFFMLERKQSLVYTGKAAHKIRTVLHQKWAALAWTEQSMKQPPWKAAPDISKKLILPHLRGLALTSIPAALILQDPQTVQTEDFIFGRTDFPKRRTFSFQKGEHFLILLTAGKSADAQLEYQRLKLLTADLIQFNH